MFASQNPAAFRFATFSGRGRSLRNTSRPLSNDEIRSVAPSVFADQAHESRSARYAYIPTAQVLDGLRREGFEVFGAHQAVTRKEDRHEHTKHLLRLRHRSQFEGLTAGDSVAEIVLLNSHDGSSSYQMHGGMFRIVCTNGLVVPDGVCQRVKVPHSGQVADRVAAGAFEVLDGLTRVIEHRDAMRALPLNPGEAAAFARAAAMLRFEPADDAAAPPVTPEQVLRPRRQADTAPDLWTTFNRVQENLVRGGLSARTATGTRQRTRAVTGIDQDVKLNKALWSLAEEMRALKAAT
jgi:hypothetical protein